MAATDYDFKATRNEIIELSFKLIGVLSPGDVLTAEQLDEGIKMLNLLIKNLQTEHIFIWTLQAVTQNLVDGDPDYTLTNDPAILWIDDAILSDGTTEWPIKQITFRDYQALTDKDTEGAPIEYTIDNGTSPMLYVWPTPEKAYTLRLLAAVKAKDWDLSTSDGSFPVQFQRPLIYALAADLSDLYQKPITERQELEKKASYLMGKVYAADRERTDLSFVKGAF